MFLLILIFLPLAVVREWFLPGMPQTHDAEVHISRAAMMATSIREGNILPRWGGYFNWGYGTPSIMFLYPGLPYLGALVHLLTGLTFIQTYKIFIVVSYVASSLLWFFLMKMWGFSRRASLVSSLFYILAPYRLVNIFVRGALAEHLGFTIFPLLLIVFTKLTMTISRRWVGLGVLVVAASILTHNLSALLYLPIVAILPLIFRTITPTSHLIPVKTLVGYYTSLALGFALATFFWLPALLESRYTLARWMFSTRDWYADHFLSLKQLVWSPWGYGWSLPGVENDGISFQIGIAQWTVLLVSIALILSKKKFMVHGSRFVVFSLALVVLGIFMVLPISHPVWRAISILPKFQFPWRFLSYVVIGSSVLAAVVTDTIKKRIPIIALAILPIVTTVSYWKTAGPSTLTEAFLTYDYVGTSDTGETTPIWAVRFQEKKAKAPVEVVSAPDRDFVEIIPEEHLQERHTFRVKARGPARLVDNTLYFPGWTVLVDGNPVPIEPHDENWRGLITFPIERGDHSVVVEFRETLTRKLSNAISLVGLGILFVLLRSRTMKGHQ